MTRKDKIIRMVQQLKEADVTYERVIYHLNVMAAIEEGTAQADRGEGMEHGQLVRRLEAEWRELDSSGSRERKKTSAVSAGTSPKTRRSGPRRSRSA